MTTEQAYRLGILDVVQGRHTLAGVLFAAEENRLLFWYVKGSVVGRRLLSGEAVI